MSLSQGAKLQSGAFSVSALIAVCTIIVSLSVAFVVNGSFVEDVRIIDLAKWGGITWQKFSAGEIWLLGSSQMVHVKIPHMFFNVVCLFCVGIYVESTAGWRVVFALWLLAGGLATLISPFGVEPPYNVGTGASHAVLALGGFAAVLMIHANSRPNWAIVAMIVAILPPFFIDFAFVGHAKLGHIVGLFLGISFGVLCVMSNKICPVLYKE